MMMKLIVNDCVNQFIIADSTMMEGIGAYQTRLALRGTPIQSNNTNNSHNIRVKTKRVKESGEYTPLNIQPKSLNKISQPVPNEPRINYSSRPLPDMHKRRSEGMEEAVESEIEHKPNVSADRLTFPNPHAVSRVQRFKKANSMKAKKCTCGDCEECLKDFAHFLQIFSTDESLPEISAKSWCIWRKNKNNKFMYYYGKRIHKVREIASLTKMITAMAAIDFLTKYNYDPIKVTYKIRKPSTMVGGTSAQLQIGEVYSIDELLYGLMLPSGNDAAIAISQAIGLLQNLKMRNKAIDPHKEEWYDPYIGNNNKSYAYLFITTMNEKCQKLGLLDTKIYNSHGNDAYDQLKNVSTCNQVAKISAEYLKYDILKKVAQTQAFSVPRFDKTWENTNKLLEDGFEGLKTGITDTAGPCLAASYRGLIVVVLSSKSMNQRWIEVKKLVRWIVRRGL